MKKTLDPGLRRDDQSSADGRNTVISAQAELPQLSSSNGGSTFDVIRSNRFSVLLPLITAVIMLYAVSIPWWGESSWMREVVEISCYFVFAMMWNLLAGYGGMVSIGQQAFLGFGGYIMLILGNEAGMNPFVAIPIAALATVVIAYPVSFIAFRLHILPSLGGYRREFKLRFPTAIRHIGLRLCFWIKQARYLVVGHQSTLDITQAMTRYLVAILMINCR